MIYAQTCCLTIQGSQSAFCIFSCHEGNKTAVGDPSSLFLCAWPHNLNAGKRAVFAKLFTEHLLRHLLRHTMVNFDVMRLFPCCKYKQCRFTFNLTFSKIVMKNQCLLTLGLMQPMYRFVVFGTAGSSSNTTRQCMKLFYFPLDL